MPALGRGPGDPEKRRSRPPPRLAIDNEGVEPADARGAAGSETLALYQRSAAPIPAMDACIYYELDALEAEDGERARRAAPAGASEVMWSGSPAPPELCGPLVRIPGPRATPFLADAMATIDAWRREVDDRWHPVGEVARYELMLGLAADLHRPWALARMREQMHPDAIVWATPGGVLADLRPHHSLGCAPDVQIVPLRARPISLRKRAKELAYDHLRRPIVGRLRARTAPTASGASRGRVLFVEFYPNNAKILVGLAEAVKAEGHEVVWVSGRKEVTDRLVAAGVTDPIRELPDPKCVRVNGALRRDVRALRQRIPRLAPPGDGAAAGSWSTLQGRLRLDQILRESAAWYAGLRQTLEALAPSAVVSSTFSDFCGRAAAAAAEDLGLPSVYVQHGAQPYDYTNAFFVHRWAFTWGEQGRRALAANAPTPPKALATGSPLYDDLIARVKARGPRPFPTDRRPVVAYLAPRSGGAICSIPLARRLLAALVRAVEGLDWKHTVKPHPGDHTGVLPAVLPRNPSFELYDSGSSQDLILSADIVVVTSSTTGFEACLADRPLIVLLLEGGTDFCGYVEHGAAIAATTEQALEQALRTLAGDDAQLEALRAGRRRLIDEVLAGGNGDAVRRAATWVSKIARQDPVDTGPDPRVGQGP